MSCWKTLGIDSSADERQIKRAYAGLLRLHHPEDEPEKFQQIRAAYERALKTARNGSRSGTAPEPERPVETPQLVRQRPRRAEPKEVFLEEKEDNDRNKSALPITWLDSDDSELQKNGRSYPTGERLVRNPELELVDPATLEADFLAAVKRIFHETSDVSGALLAHPALTSLEAKERLFHSIFAEILRLEESETPPNFKVLLRLNEIFCWTGDELMLAKKFKGANLNAVFEFFREDEHVRRFHEARRSLLRGIRWHVEVHLAGYLFYALVLAFL